MRPFPKVMSSMRGEPGSLTNRERCYPRILHSSRLPQTQKFPGCAQRLRSGANGVCGPEPHARVAERALPCGSGRVGGHESAATMTEKIERVGRLAAGPPNGSRSTIRHVSRRHTASRTPRRVEKRPAAVVRARLSRQGLVDARKHPIAQTDEASVAEAPHRARPVI